MEFISQIITAEITLVSTLIKGLKIALQALYGLIVGTLLVSILLSAPLLGVAIALAELTRQRWFMVASPLALGQEDSVDLGIEVLAIREIAVDHLESFQVNLSEDLISTQIASFDWSRKPLKIDSPFWSDDVGYVDSFRSGSTITSMEVTGESKGEVSVVVATLAWKELCSMARANGIKVIGKGRTRSVIESELSAVLMGKK